MRLASTRILERISGFTVTKCYNTTYFLHAATTQPLLLQKKISPTKYTATRTVAATNTMPTSQLFIMTTNTNVKTAMNGSMIADPVRPPKPGANNIQPYRNTVNPPKINISPMPEGITYKSSKLCDNPILLRI